MFLVKNLKNTNKELSEEHTCERGAPGDLKRGQAGRPRAMGPAGLGCSWPSSTSSFSGDFLAQFLASFMLCTVQNPCTTPSLSLLSTCNIISSLCVIHFVPYFIIHHMVPSLLKISCPSHAWLLPSLDHLHVVVGREHNSFL